MACLLVGCIKAGPVVQAERPVPVAIASVLASVDEADVHPAPDALRARLVETVAERNLTPVELDPAGYLGPFATARTTGSRLGLLVEGSEAPMILLVESTARFSSQINGRYRWTIDVTATLAASDAHESASSEQFTIPVALVYYHEKEADALAEAAPLVARRVGALLDAWIGAQAAR